MILEIDDSDDLILDSLILVPQYPEPEFEAEIDLLNDQTCFWLWGNLDTREYLGLVNDTTGDVQQHLNQMERALKCLT